MWLDSISGGAFQEDQPENYTTYGYADGQHCPGIGLTATNGMCPASNFAEIDPRIPDPSKTDVSCNTAQSGSSTQCAYDDSAVQKEKNIGDGPCDCQNTANDGNFFNWLFSGNPVNHGTGNKLEVAVDYAPGPGVGFGIVRTYNSQSVRNGRFGRSWNNNYERFVFAKADASAAIVRRGDGQEIKFTLTNGSYKPDADILDTLTVQRDSNSVITGWTYVVNADKSVETYDPKGRVIKIAALNGRFVTLAYSTLGLLNTVTDNFNHVMTFAYNINNLVTQITYGDTSTKIAYAYDTLNRLTTVTYAGGSIRTYVYNESAYDGGTSQPNLLTGIIDENNNRFATFTYNAVGKAIATEHAGGTYEYQIAYTTDLAKSAVTDPLGAVRNYSFQLVQNMLKTTGVTLPAGAGSAASTLGTTYDANGNVASYTDANGLKTTFVYDLSRNLETSRTEAAGTASARTVSTAWHATLHLPLKMAAPLLLTTFTYDSAGNLLTRTIQATTDATGAAGLTPTVTGAARTWTYTYNSFGQVLTMTSPRTDLAEVTRYAYDTVGNLTSVTSPTGRVTTLGNYDQNGRVGKIVSANGITTTIQYDKLGRVTSQYDSSPDAGAKITSFVYTPSGQLSKLTLPDTSFISYSYDAAQRLTGLTDNLGNSIAYTLDNMGNILTAKTSDPAGVLTRQISRSIDALNRVQQITGGVQ